ncbi:glycosyltransferase family 4 protein [Salinibius halmophilus]|uniref:glycosyltransferase family 4 protein n=1 Tax=Salinibius halmophilus TaxID=1853216 RepID=UPI000E661673|nr:glycosyltransferase family 4 protein [Salinibius halmophilus]
MIKVGITEYHGIAQEYTSLPPAGITYSPVDMNTRWTSKIFKTPAKGVYGYVKGDEHDVIEAPIFPVLTNKPWIFTPARLSSAGTFDLFGIPTPRFAKMLFIESLLKRNNFKNLLFKSQHGMESLKSYGSVSNELIIQKCSVVYPVVRRVPDEKIKFNSEVKNLLFVGEFLRKGGANVVEVFLELKKEFPQLKLKICAPRVFQTNNKDLEKKYIELIDSSEDMEISFVPRDELMNSILPETDIYLCPTYQESWGFSIQEAMAYGIPVIATNISAIPEMIDNGENGVLLDIKDSDYIINSKGYMINELNTQFHNNLNDTLYQELRKLILDSDFRKKIGSGALQTARSKFSIESRNAIMKPIYEAAVS